MSESQRAVSSDFLSADILRYRHFRMGDAYISTRRIDFQPDWKNVNSLIGQTSEQEALKSKEWGDAEPEDRHL
jgi:hypothetical protein